MSESGPVRETLPEIDPRRTALLIMDYQRFIVGRLTSADILVSHAADAIAFARAQGVRIAYVRVAFDEADFAQVPETNKSFAPLAGARPSFLHSDAPESAIDPRIFPETGDIIVRKVRVGAFSTTDLEAQLRGERIDTLILAGISTSGVVLSTIRDAADRDYRLFVLSDACADTDDEVHDVLMHRVFPRQAYVLTTAQLPSLLANSR